MATVNIKVYAIKVIREDDIGVTEEIIEPLYVSESAAKVSLETYKAGHYGYIAAYLEEYTLQTTA